MLETHPVLCQLSLVVLSLLSRFLVADIKGNGIGKCFCGMAVLQATGRIVKHQAKGPVTNHAPEIRC